MENQTILSLTTNYLEGMVKLYKKFLDQVKELDSTETYTELSFKEFVNELMFAMLENKDAETTSINIWHKDQVKMDYSDLDGVKVYRTLEYNFKTNTLIEKNSMPVTKWVD